MLGFLADLQALEGNPLDASANLSHFAALQLEGVWRTARRRWRKAQAGETAQLHRLRIAFKRLRYGVEFFLPLLPSGKANRYLKQLARVQDQLGYLNDVSVAMGRLHPWGDGNAEHQLAHAFLNGWHAARSETVIKTLPELLGPLFDDSRPWQKLRPVT